jgi:hypothetical protein
MALTVLAVIFFAVAFGCFLGIFAYGHGKGPLWRAPTFQSEHSLGNEEAGHESDET